jgi:hypothetical protein
MLVVIPVHPLNERLPPLENCCQKLHVAVHPESGKSEHASFLLENIKQKDERCLQLDERCLQPLKI